MNQVQGLDHPNILKVLDLVDDEEMFGLVTERLSGEDLHRLITLSGVLFSEAEIVVLLINSMRSSYVVSARTRSSVMPPRRTSAGTWSGSRPRRSR
jgi:hypothetical protein